MKSLFTLLLISNFCLAQDCSEISKTVDKFDGKVRYTSPVLEQITFIKSINGGDTITLARISTESSTLSYGKTGIIVLFADGGRLEKKEQKIDVKASTYGYDYSALFILSPEDIEQFKRAEVTDFRLYIYDCELSKGKRKKYLAYFNCLINSM